MSLYAWVSWWSEFYKLIHSFLWHCPHLSMVSPPCFLAFSTNNVVLNLAMNCLHPCFTECQNVVVRPSWSCLPILCLTESVRKPWQRTPFHKGNLAAIVPFCTVGSGLTDSSSAHDSFSLPSTLIFATK